VSGRGEERFSLPTFTRLLRTDGVVGFWDMRCRRLICTAGATFRSYSLDPSQRGQRSAELQKERLELATLLFLVEKPTNTLAVTYPHVLPTPEY